MLLDRSERQDHHRPIAVERLDRRRRSVLPSASPLQRKFIKMVANGLKVVRIVQPIRGPSIVPRAFICQKACRRFGGHKTGRETWRFKRLLAASAIVGGALFAQPAAAQDITLEFTVWNYSLDTIEDNVKQFEAENPGIKVNMTDYTWQDYHDSMVLRFRGGTQTDVAYVGQDWLPAWAAAGFLAPLDDIAPADVLADLKSDMAGFSLGRHDLQRQALRPALLRRHDLLHLQQEDPRGCRHRRADDLGRGDGGSREAEGRRHGASDRLRVRSGASELLRRLRQRRSMAAAATSSTRSSKAIFDDPDNPAYKQLEWLADAFKKDLVQQETHESKVIPSMNTGKHAFTVALQLCARRDEQRRRAAARRPVRDCSDARRGARGARLHKILLRSRRRRRPIRRAPRRRGSS